MDRSLPRKFSEPRLENIWDSVYGAVFAAELFQQWNADRLSTTQRDLIRDCESIRHVAMMAADMAVKHLVNEEDYEEKDRSWIEGDHLSPFK